MQSLIKTIFAATLLILVSLPALALDQIKLVTDQVVTGQVVNETPEFVDILLKNGLGKRIPRAAIASVDHDISIHDPSAVPGPPILFASLTLGGLLLTGHTDADSVILDYGAKFGFLAGKIGNFKLAFAASVDHASTTTTLEEGVFHASGFTDYSLQMLLSPIHASGFYFGPNLGVLFRSDTIDDVDTGSGGKNFELGAGLGYAFFISNQFTLGPELRYDHDFGPTYLNLIKFTMAGTVHF